MNITGNRVVDGLLALATVAAAVIAMPLAANLGLLWLYIEPNPRHLPPVLMEEAIGWAILGLGAGAIPVVIAETVAWPGGRGFWERYQGLIIGGGIGLIIGAILGLFFAIIQMPSIDGQAMESRGLASLAGGTTGLVGAMAGIIAGAILRRYILTLYRLPDSADRRNPTGLTPEQDSGNPIAGAGGPPPERSSYAREYP